MKTLLIDGNSLINRAFYALPVLSTAEGVYTNAVYGFLKMFYKAADEYAPDAVVCAFDLKQPTFRHKMYEAYKAGRRKMPEELVPQIPLLKEVLGKLGVACRECPGFEADDIIGTYARLSDEAGGTCAILTGDRDSFQLVSDKTSVWFTKKGISEILCLTPENIETEYGVKASQVTDLKGLMGDSSDNLPGIAGVGEKTALNLIKQYGTLENVLAHGEEIPGKLGEKVRAGREDAEKTKVLATIVRNVDVPPLADCLYQPPADDVAAGIFRQYEFKSLLERVGGETETYTFASRDLAEFSMQGDTLAFLLTDTGLSVAVSPKEQFETSLVFDLLSPGISREDALAFLKPYIEDKNIKKIVYDAKSAYHTLGYFDAAGDVMLAEYLLDAGGDDFSLENIAARYQTLPGAAALLHIHQKQETAMKAKGVFDLYRTMELPLARVLFEMEQVGFFVEKHALTDLGEEFQKKIKALSADIFLYAGHEFNINSTQQLGEVLFTELGLPAQKKTKRGYSTDNDVLESLEHPIAPLVIEYRQMQKLKSTYVDGMFPLIDPHDGRIHTTFKQAVAATGRISSVEPNLQNIPVRSEAGREIRKAFLAENDDAVLVNADYSQIELRILAHLSGDETLVQSFRSGEDIHARTAALVMNVPLEEVTKEMRSRAKAVNFGIVYGISDFGLAKSINSTKKEAAAFMETYFERYPKVKGYMTASVAEAKQRGSAQTIFGRRREIPQLRASNFNVRAFGERVAMNAPIQGSAADIIKLAMLRVAERLREKPELGRLILQVHDELIIEAPREHAEETAAMLKSVMENVCELFVPLVAETNIGRTWFELK